MYSFEGDYKRRPVQALGGASKKESKDVLLQRTQEERRLREEMKRRHHSAVVIQSAFRSATVRHYAKQQSRHEFDVEMDRRQRAPPRPVSDDTVSQLDVMARHLLFFYQPTLDTTRLTWLCQQFVLQQSKMAVAIAVPANTVGRHRIKRLLTLCCRQLEVVGDNIAMPLRMVEIYTDPKTYVSSDSNDTATALMSHLVTNGYYQCLRSLAESRLPSCIEQSDSVTPPTALADTILMLLTRPLTLDTDSTSSFSTESLRQLTRSLFCSRYSQPISNFLLPAITRDCRFPFVRLLHSLLPTDITDSVNSVGSDSRVRCLTVEPSIWLLHAILTLATPHIDSLSDDDTHTLLLILSHLVPHLSISSSTTTTAGDVDDLESDDEPMDVDCQTEVSEVCQSCVEMINNQVIVSKILRLTERRPTLSVMTCMSTICHTLLHHVKLAIHRTRLLYSLAFNPTLLRRLWSACETVSTKSATGLRTSLLSLLTRGLQMSAAELAGIVPLISVFCAVFSHVLTLMHDVEFFEQQPPTCRTMPFRLSELAQMSLTLRDVCLGIIDLTHPDTRPTPLNTAPQLHVLAYLFRVTVGLVKQLHQRDCRKVFCPPDHWLSSRPIFHFVANKPTVLSSPQAVAFVRRPFGSLSILNPHRPVDDDAPRLSSTEVRKLITLMELPFVVPFEDRVKVFHQLIHQDRLEHQGQAINFGVGPTINIAVRRNYLYEDAFEKLSPDNEPNLKLRMQVRLMNFAGLDEAGIDGGGIFREFMSELIKTAFDPNRGFFCCTADKLLYPNPQARLLVENFTSHYYFLGRVLGKVLYENMLTELPFASFFLSKLLSSQKGDVDIHHLASLDPEMYRNLLFLKDFDGDVSELGLDFTVANNDFGETQVDELKHGGRDTQVTNSNRIEYIHLMADYRLNRQIRAHCQSFRAGLNDVVNIDWLRTFDHNELQVLISGAQVDIDVDDLRQHTNYSGGYTADHEVIKMFWRVIDSFTDDQRRQLLKFVTSCSRPPLLGFKNLYPSFCVHHAGSEPDRLPTASTCMNLLKLPEFNDEDTLRQKLLYAIESGAGFELS